MNDQIKNIQQQAIDEKVFPGSVVGYIKDGKSEVIPAGNFTYEADSQQVSEDAIYDVASITKVIPSALCLLHLIDTGKISFDDKVVSFIPEFNTSEGKDEVTMRHVLTYTLDLDIPAMRELKDKSAEELIAVVMNAPLKNKPGTRHIYTNSTAALFAPIIEKVTGKDFYRFSQEFLFSPLAMKDTTFFPESVDKEKIVPTEYDDWRGTLVHGIVHDESSYIMRRDGYQTAVAGLFSTVPDLLRCAHMILNKGAYENQTFLSKEMIAQMCTNQSGDENNQYGLAWEMHEPEFMGKHLGDHTVVMRGYTGCSIQLDIDKQAALIILSNRVHPKRPENGDGINWVRRSLADIIFK